MCHGIWKSPPQNPPIHLRSGLVGKGNCKGLLQGLGFVSCHIQVGNQPNTSPAWWRLQRIKETLGGREIWKSLSDCLLKAGLCPTPDQPWCRLGSCSFPSFPEYSQSPVTELFLMFTLNIPTSRRNNAGGGFWVTGLH